MKKYLINLLLISSLITGCSKKEEIITNQNIDEKQKVETKTDKEEFSDNENISNNTIPSEYEEVSYSDYTNPIYSQMSNEFFEQNEKRNPLL